MNQNRNRNRNRNRGNLAQVAKSGSDFLNTPGPAGDIVSELVKAAAKNPEAAKEIASEIAKTVPEIAKNKELGEETSSYSTTLGLRHLTYQICTRI